MLKRSSYCYTYLHAECVCERDIMKPTKQNSTAEYYTQMTTENMNYC